MLSGTSTPRGRGSSGGLDSQKVLDMVMKLSENHQERIDRMHKESAHRASLAAIHALTEVRMGAESAQSHMALQPLLASTMAQGNTQQAAALMYQQQAASAMRMAHQTEHVQFQAGAFSGTRLSVTQGSTQTVPQAHRAVMPDLNVFSLAQQPQQQQHQQNQ